MNDLRMKKLEKIAGYDGPDGPVALIIMDGVGIGKGDPGDMVAAATTPNLDWLKENALVTQLKAHGLAVGMPTDADMGNSEVGHNAIGAGRVFDQGALLVKNSVESGGIYEGQNWKYLVNGVRENDSTLHYIGLLSDGNVHSHIDILIAMLRHSCELGIKKVRVHTLLDGRDVPPQSAHLYVEQLETVLAEINSKGFDYCIASGGGRLYITMDRYNADWEMVRRGWETHVHGKGRAFESAQEAIKQLRADDPGAVDQDLKEFVIYRDGKPVGPIVDGDSVVLFNFRGDRAIEISRAFDDTVLSEFDRGDVPDVRFAGIMEYDPDQKIPVRFLVEPPAIDSVLGEYLAGTGLSQLAVSETQKYGHVTYFFNGNRSDKFSEELEEYVEIKSDNCPFQQRPWMKAAEITDVVLNSISGNHHDFIRVNYPNGDMIGHTGDLLAVQISVEATDLCVGRLIEAIDRQGGVLIVTADHGNADEMYQLDKTGNVETDSDGKPKVKTSHTLNPVPCYIYDPSGKLPLSLSDASDLGISSLAATVAICLGYQPPAEYDPAIVEIGSTVEART